MSRAAFVNPWDADTSKMSIGLTTGTKVMLTWFVLCIALATIGVTFTADVPGARARALIVAAR